MELYFVCVCEGGGDELEPELNDCEIWLGNLFYFLTLSQCFLVKTCFSEFYSINSRFTKVLFDEQLKLGSNGINSNQSPFRHPTGCSWSYTP